MRTMSLLLCCGQNQTATIDWSPMIKSAPCICWGIIGLIALYFLFKYVAAPKIAHCCEKEMKDKAFEQEKFWAFYNSQEKPVKEKLEKVQKELDELKKKEDGLDEGSSKLEKERAEFDKKILEEKIKVYQEIINNK